MCLGSGLQWSDSLQSPSMLESEGCRGFAVCQWGFTVGFRGICINAFYFSVIIIEDAAATESDASKDVVR